MTQTHPSQNLGVKDNSYSCNPAYEALAPPFQYPTPSYTSPGTDHEISQPMMDQKPPSSPYDCGQDETSPPHQGGHGIPSPLSEYEADARHESVDDIADRLSNMASGDNESDQEDDSNTPTPSSYKAATRKATAPPRCITPARTLAPTKRKSLGQSVGVLRLRSRIVARPYVRHVSRERTPTSRSIQPKTTATQDDGGLTRQAIQSASANVPGAACPLIFEPGTATASFDHVPASSNPPILSTQSRPSPRAALPPAPVQQTNTSTTHPPNAPNNPISNHRSSFSLASSSLRSSDSLLSDDEDDPMSEHTATPQTEQHNYEFWSKVAEVKKYERRTQRMKLRLYRPAIQEVRELQREIKRLKRQVYRESEKDEMTKKQGRKLWAPWDAASRQDEGENRTPVPASVGVPGYQQQTPSSCTINSPSRQHQPHQQTVNDGTPAAIVTPDRHPSWFATHLSPQQHATDICSHPHPTTPEAGPSSAPTPKPLYHRCDLHGTPYAPHESYNVSNDNAFSFNRFTSAEKGKGKAD
nr:uncharacterized protein CI109_000580 [Kwoniella shandongensis]KAA5531008.1 hypothetical protein CI109_000580 [Kwoniella shandongensis]